METLEQKIARVVQEHVAIVPYDRAWPNLFERERDHLRSCLPGDLVGRIEHFGCTAVPGLAAKPIVDILVEVADLEETKTRIAPLLEAQGYDYFWRASSGASTPPFYAWFIKRDAHGVRTHHIHMVEAHFEHWNRLLFRDYLIQHPDIAREYAALKMRLSEQHGRDRVAYTEAKSDFIVAVTARARESMEDRSVSSPEAAIAALLNDWAFFRDQGSWDALLGTFHEDGTISLSWYDGPYAGFVAASRKLVTNPNTLVKHHLGVPRIEVDGDRALSEVDVTIMLRAKAPFGEVDTTSLARFYDRLERRDGTWKVLSRTAVYEKDRADPVSQPSLPAAYFENLEQ
jgi:GrpB-like predicted nucleotidyltransferase (UPF0157 family)